MSELPDSLLGAAADRVANTEAAITQLAKVVGLELVDIYLDQGGAPDQDTVERLTEIAGSLITIAGISVDLLKDIAPLAGLNIHMNGGAPRLVDEPVEQPALPPGRPTSNTEVPVQDTAITEPSVSEVPAVTNPMGGGQEPTAQPVLAQDTVLDTQPPQASGDSASPESAGSSEEREVVERDLYKRVCDLEAFPAIQLLEGAPVIKLTVAGNNHVRLGDRVLTLDKHELYLFNAMLMLRDGVRTGGELRAFGFYPEASSDGSIAGTFSKAMNGLIEKLNSTAGIELFKKTGAARGTRYIVNPNLVLEDGRDPNSPDYIPTDSDVLAGEIVKRRPRREYQKRITTPSRAALEAESNEAPPTLDEEKIAENATAIQRMVVLYQDSRRVRRFVDAYRTSVVPHKSPMSDPIGRYLQEIAQYRLLTAEEEVTLFGAIATGIEAQDKIDLDPNLLSTDPEILHQVQDAVAARQVLIVCNMRLAVDRAKRLNYASKTMDLMARIQEGTMGVARAIETFDPDKGWKFSTYATQWVDQHIRRAIANEDKTIRIPVHMLDKIYKVGGIRSKLQVKLGRSVTDEEIAEASEGEFTKEAVEHLTRVGRIDASSVSLNEPIRVKAAKGSEAGESYVEDYVAGSGEGDLEEYLKDIEDQRKVEELIENSGLTPRDKFILSARFGLLISSLMGRTIELNGTEIAYEDALGWALVNGKGMTLEDTSKFLGLTRERVRQIESKLLARLVNQKRIIGSSYDD